MLRYDVAMKEARMQEEKHRERVDEENFDEDFETQSGERDQHDALFDSLT